MIYIRLLSLSFFLLFGQIVYSQDAPLIPPGDPDRGRLIFGQCRTCHYPEKAVGHNNGPSLHKIFGKIVGKQKGFENYSETFKNAKFKWTPTFMFYWLANPMKMFPESNMMSLGIHDSQDRSDLVAYLIQASESDL